MLKTDGSAEFKGKLVAPSGTIGGFTIDGSTLYAGNKFGTGDYTGMCIQNLSTDRKFSVYKGNGNEVKMYQDAGGYGITALYSGNTVFQLGSINKIGGWNFDGESLYSGTTKPTVDSTTGLSSAGLVLGADGSIAAQNFCLKSDGTGKVGPFIINKDNLTATAATSGVNNSLKLSSSSIIFMASSSYGATVYMGTTGGWFSNTANLCIQNGDFWMQGQVKESNGSLRACRFYTSDIIMRSVMQMRSGSSITTESGDILLKNGCSGGIIKDFSITQKYVNIPCDYSLGTISSVTYSGAEIYIKEGFRGQRLELLNYTEKDVILMNNATGKLMTRLNGQQAAILYFSGSTWVGVMVGSFYRT